LIDFILILEFETVNVISNFTLGVDYGKVFLLEKIKSHQFVFIELALESTYHVFILELGVWRVIIYYRKKPEPS
jgi:hypothetical protein